MNNDNDWHLLLSSHDEIEAYITKGFLEANGVPTRLENASFHEMPISFGGFSEVRILVPIDRADEAERLMVEVEDKFLYCSDCGERCFETDRFCRNCGIKFDDEDTGSVAANFQNDN